MARAPARWCGRRLTDPRLLAGDVFAADNLEYWLHLLWPFGFLPLLSPVTLLIAAPELALNALSSVIWQRSIQFHYTAAEIPFFFAAAVFGLMRLWRWLGGGWRRPESAMRGELLGRADLALVVLLLSLAASYVLGPLPFSLPGAHYNGKAYAKTGHAAVLDMAVAMVPDGVTASVNNNVGSHLSARRVVYTFPDYAGAKYVVVDQSRPSVYDRTDKILHDQALGRLVLDTRYVSVFARDKVFVFKLVSGSGEGQGSGASQGSGAGGSSDEGGATPGTSASPSGGAGSAD